MKVLKESVRYQLLIKQFQLDNSTLTWEKIENSLERIFLYIYKYTTIMYIEFIDEKVLFNYIKFHRLKNFEEISFSEAIRDVKILLYFLEKIKGIKKIHGVNFSVNNYSLWTRL